MQEDEIDLLALAQLLWKEKRLILAITTLATAIAVIVALVMTPVYQSSVLVSPVTTGSDKSSALGSLGGLAALAGISVGTTGSSVDTAIATLNSRQFLMKFVNEKNLKPILFDDRWDAQAKAWIDEGPGLFARIKQALMPTSNEREPQESLAPGEPTSNQTCKLLIDEVITVEKAKDTGLVTLQVSWTDPNVAADWANELVARVNAELRKDAIQDAEKKISYLTEQVSNTNVAALQATLFRLIEEYMKNMTLAKTQPEYAFKIIDPAVAPDWNQRVKPKRGLIVILGMFVGGLFGVLVAFVREGIRQKFPNTKAP